MRKTDYLIIGAGIVVCSAAYLLTKDGKKVTIVDKSYPCNEASGVNAGGMELLQQPPKSLPMHVLAAQLWDMFQNEDGIDCGYHRTGGLYCVLREEDSNPLKAGVAILMKAKELGCEFYDHQFIKEIHISKENGYLAYAEDGQVYQAKKILITGGIRSPWLLDQMGVHIELEEKHNMIDHNTNDDDEADSRRFCFDRWWT